jgi:hypothetical protein
MFPHTTHVESITMFKKLESRAQPCSRQCLIDILRANPFNATLFWHNSN